MKSRQEVMIILKAVLVYLAIKRLKTDMVQIVRVSDNRKIFFNTPLTFLFNESIFPLVNDRKEGGEHIVENIPAE